MNRADIAFHAGLIANGVVRNHKLTALPVNPIALAEAVGIHVSSKAAKGVSGMLLRSGNDFGIIYSTHIASAGFQNFSIAHELGHYFMPGHIDAVLRSNGIHQSHAGFDSDDQYELEADHFAAALLMPESLFTDAVGRAGGGLSAIEGLADLCVTSLTATAIRYVKCTEDAAAVVMSAGRRIS